MLKIALALVLFLSTLSFVNAADSKDIQLKKPQLKAGLPVMQALAKRQSVRDYADKELDLQTLSNLLWAAVGVNRPDGKRTAPTAMNRQEIDIYACLKTGAYFYNPQNNVLEFVSEENCRLRNAPVTLIITAKAEKESTWANIDAGIVSQNISLFAAGMGLATVPQGSMPKEDFAKILKTNSGQQLILNHPIGYPKIEKTKK